MSFLWNSISRLWDSLMQSLGLAGKKGNLILLGLDNSGKTTLLHRLQACGDESIGQAVFPPTDRPTQNSFSYQKITFTAWDLGGHEVVRHLWQDYAAAATSTNNNTRSTSASRAPISAILFLIDASDSQRLEEAAYELDHLIHETLLQENDDDDRACSTTAASMAIQDGHYDDDDNDYDASHSVNGNGQVHAVPSRKNNSSSKIIPPIAILLNKCDLETALSTEEICRRIELDTLQTSISSSRHHYGNDDAVSSHLQVFRVSVLQGQGYPQAFQWIASFL